MRSQRSLRWIALTLLAAIAITPTPQSQAVSIPFRGGAEDHYWDVAVVFCRDALRVAGQEIVHPDNSTGDNLAFSLVLSRTATLITDPLPIKMASAVGGPSRTLAKTTVAYTYAEPQVIGTPLSVIVERWEHGEESAVETGGDLSDGDDEETISGSVVNCTAATPPSFDEPPSEPSGRVLNIAPGSALQVALQASDGDIYDTTVAIVADSLPGGAALIADTLGNPAISTLAWTPTAGDVGQHLITLRAQDPTGRESQPYALTVNVGTPISLPLVAH